MLGYPLESWLEPGLWAAHLHPEDRDWAIEQPVLLARTKDRFELEYRMIAADERAHLRALPLASVTRRLGILLSSSGRKYFEKHSGGET
jgi:PAS domain-containing protein